MDYTGDDLMRITAALSSPHRMRIIATLVAGPVYVSQLARELNISRPLLQVHLRKLEQAGLVASELRLSDEGKAMNFYRIEPFDLRLTADSVATATLSLTETGGNTE